MLADSTIIDSVVALRQLFLYISVSCDFRMNLPLRCYTNKRVLRDALKMTGHY